MAQLEKVRLPNGNVVVPGDWGGGTRPLWSRVDIGPGPIAPLEAFSYSKGGAIPGSVGPLIASDLDTNLQGEGGRLPENEELIAMSLNISCFKQGPAANVNAFPDADPPGVPLPDMLRLQRDVVVQFRIASVKDYTESPMSYFNAGMGVVSTYAGGRSKVSAGAPTGEVVSYNGYPNRYDARQFGAPNYIAPGETFNVRLTAGNGEVIGLNLAPDSRIITRVYLFGYRRTPVA